MSENKQIENLSIASLDKELMLMKEKVDTIRIIVDACEKEVESILRDNEQHLNDAIE
tara:strand:- start:3029 stop:3199 length:171 start_codon:yes stop_codon:yes gene_type:complete